MRPYHFPALAWAVIYKYVDSLQASGDAEAMVEKPLPLGDARKLLDQNNKNGMGKGTGKDKK